MRPNFLYHLSASLRSSVFHLLICNIPSITATSTAKPPNTQPSIDPTSNPLLLSLLPDCLERRMATVRVVWVKSGVGIGIVEACKAAR